jgi:hypothetical protein
MIRLAAVLAASVAVTGCSTLPTEQQLVGTWRMPADRNENEFGVVTWQSKQMAEITVRPDHTYISRRLGERRSVSGHWQLNGRWLSWDGPSLTKGRRVMKRDRAEILKLSDRELVLPDNDKWTRVR